MKTLILTLFFLITYCIGINAQSNISFSISPFSYNLSNSNIKDKGLGYYPIKNNKKFSYGASIKYVYHPIKWFNFNVGINYDNYIQNTELNIQNPISEIDDIINTRTLTTYNFNYNLHLFGISSGFNFNLKNWNIGLDIITYPYYKFKFKEELTEEDFVLISSYYKFNYDAKLIQKQRLNYNPLLNELTYLNFNIGYDVTKHFVIFASVQYNCFVKNRTKYQYISIAGNTFKEGYNNPNVIYNLSQIEHNSSLLLFKVGLTYTIFKPKYKYKTKKELAVEGK